MAGAASLGGCYIKKIIKDPALSDGQLRPGDRLLEVSHSSHVSTRWLDGYHSIFFSESGEKYRNADIFITRTSETVSTGSLSIMRECCR